MAAPTALPDPVVYKDAEIVHMPHWLESDGTTVIKNSAGGIFPKPIVEPISIGIIHGIIHKSTYSDTEYATQLNAINNGNWRGWATGKAWVSRILVEDTTVNNNNAKRVHYIVRCCEYGWNTTIPQMGHFYNDSGKKAFVGGIGLLSSDGTELASEDDPVISDIEIKRPIAFSTLGF